MRLRIVHATTYRYRREVAFNSHRLILRPRSGPDLQVLKHALRLSPAAELLWGQDVFGNLVALANVASSADELSITSLLEVEMTAAAWPVFPIETRAHAYPFRYTDDEILDLGALLGAAADPAVGSWAQGFLASGPTDTLSLLKQLNAGVPAAVAYKSRDEEGTQPAAETLRLASGSCRDLAALFIDAVRSLGFGARAVSGYLPVSSPLASTAATTHAWAEVFLPGAGWIAFDPTHARMGSDGLIPIAVGRCSAQVLPIIGTYVGAAQDFAGMDVNVRIRPLGPASGAPQNAVCWDALSSKSPLRT